MRALLAVAVALTGCALLGDSGGGNQNLPVSGAGPFGKLQDLSGKTPLTEPFVVTDPLSPISDPSPLVLPGGTFRIFYARNGSEIWRADLPPSLAELAANPVSVLAPMGDEGRAAAPSVLRRENQLLLYYETAAGIARASSLDDGATFTRDGVVIPGGTRPGAVLVVEVVFIYFTRPGDPNVWVATSTDGMAFDVASTPVLTPSGTWDALGLADPSAAVTMPTGELHIGVYYTGTSAAGTTAIGYAGSDDGFHFQAEPTPIMEPGLPSETGPAALLTPGRAILLFTQDHAGKLAIAAATDP